MSARLLATALGATLVATTAAGAAAAPGPPWSTADTASAVGQNAGVGVARLDDRGNGWLAYTRCAGQAAGLGCVGPGSLQARRITAAGLGPDRRIAGVAPRQVVLDDQPGGRFTLHWAVSGNRWRQATGAGSRLGPARRSLPPDGGGAFVDRNARGQALSVLGRGRNLIVRYRPGPRARWQRAFILRPSANLAAGTGAIDNRGRASVFWATALPAFGQNQVVRPKVSDRRPSGRFITRNLTPASLAVFNPVFAANDRGDQIAAWNVCSTGTFATDGARLCTGDVLVQLARRPAGATRFGAPRTLARGPAAGVGAPFVSMSAARALVAWQDPTGVHAATARIRGSVSTRTLAGPPGPDDALITILVGNERGQALVGWTRQQDPAACTAAIGAPFCTAPFASVRQRNGRWSDPAQLDGAGVTITPPVFAINRMGRAIALWVNGDPASRSTALRYARNTIR